MSLLLKNLLVLDSNSPLHNKTTDILIENGVITSLAGGKATEELDFDGMLVTYGWFDLNSNFNDPGLEHKEDIVSGSMTASSGGFTDVCLIPDTSPTIETKSDVSYLKRRSTEYVDLHVIASVSEGLLGENLTEMMDLHQAGAIAFSSGDSPIWNSELMMKALEYTQSIKTPIFQNPRDINLSRGTYMHEGLVSTRLGLRGEPSISEELSIHRDIEILKYSGGSIHFSMLTTEIGVDLVRRAKEEGCSVSCDVSIHHLLFTDESVGIFDTNYKNLPPFRSERDRKALVEGILDGTIDAICSNHRPHDQEGKLVEFDLADNGAISLQTFYPCLISLSDEIPLNILIEKVVSGPRKVLGMKLSRIAEGESAKLTILDPNEPWTLNNETNKSKAKNSPFWEKKLKGKVVATVNNGNLLKN